MIAWLSWWLPHKGGRKILCCSLSWVTGVTTKDFPVSFMLCAHSALWHHNFSAMKHPARLLVHGDSMTVLLFFSHRLEQELEALKQTMVQQREVYKGKVRLNSHISAYVPACQRCLYIVYGDVLKSKRSFTGTFFSLWVCTESTIIVLNYVFSLGIVSAWQGMRRFSRNVW